MGIGTQAHDEIQSSKSSLSNGSVNLKVPQMPNMLQRFFNDTLRQDFIITVVIILSSVTVIAE